MMHHTEPHYLTLQVYGRQSSSPIFEVAETYISRVHLLHCYLMSMHKPLMNMLKKGTACTNSSPPVGLSPQACDSHTLSN